MPELRKKMGRPAHQPTNKSREQVELMVAFGNTVEQIAQIMGICEKTLQTYYGVELATGRIKVNNKVAANLLRQAMKDDQKAFPAMKFWLNCRAYWSEYAPLASDKPGKKEQAQIIAETAEAGTGWAHLVH